jgi:hypothetical protein
MPSTSHRHSRTERLRAFADAVIHLLAALALTACAAELPHEIPDAFTPTLSRSAP